MTILRKPFVIVATMCGERQGWYLSNSIVYILNLVIPCCCIMSALPTRKPSMTISCNMKSTPTKQCSSTTLKKTPKGRMTMDRILKPFIRLSSMMISRWTDPCRKFQWTSQVLCPKGSFKIPWCLYLQQATQYKAAFNIVKQPKGLKLKAGWIRHFS